MTIVNCITAGIVFCTVLFIFLCLNSARLSRMEEPLEQYQRKIAEWAEAYDKDATHMTQEQFDEIYDDVFFDGVEQ